MISHNTSGTTRVWAISLFLLLIVPTLAQAEDQVGIYFDEAYQNFSIEAPAPNTIITGYLVLNDPADNAGVAGWELCADIEGPGQFLSWELEGQTINIETAPCFQVGIGDYPLPLGPRVLLATFTLLVMEPLPISISVNPIYNASIPGEMAYLTDSDPSEIRVLHSASGNPSVAWINQQMPGAVIEPSQLNFDYVPLFNDATQTVSVYNPGGGPLFLDIELDGDAAFTLTTVSGPQTVNGGETLEIPVLFHPTEVGYFTTSLVFNHSLADNVFINGYGREPIAAWDMPPELIFGEIPIGSAVVLPFSISNTGETLLPVEPSLLSECLEFSVLNPGPYSLNPGESITLQVEFAPQSAGLIHCNLSLGSVVGSIPLFGTGHLVSLDYSLSPEFLDFPDMAVGSSVSRNISLVNTGEGDLYINVELADPSTGFAISNGSGVHNITPGNGIYFTVVFSPPAIGDFSSAVTFGLDLIPDVPLNGAGTDLVPSCIVSPEYVNFGTMSQGAYYTEHISVINNGNTPLAIDATASCSATFVVPNIFTVEPGMTHDVIISHYADSEGPWQCVINLGENACSDVTCSGVVDAGPVPGESLVGLFFDDDFYESEIQIYEAGPVDVHLVLFNSLDPGGVAGWECRLEIVGGACLLVGSDIFGDFINIGDSPDFQVGLGTPMPWAEAMHLADFNLYLIQPDQDIYLLLTPIINPSVPGTMAYLGGDTQEIYPMDTVTGWPEVAFININPLAVQAPAPEVTMLGNLVELNWDVQNHADKTFMVYRRVAGGGAESLFSQPMAAEDGRVVYHDNPTGFADGTVLHYSYAIFSGGTEVGRSPETDIVLSGLPAAVTRLLPNVPNPFNPMTEINFEMEKAGQARVSIYDVSGKLVATLVNEQLSSGPHVRVWQGRDATGRQVPSGAYYLRMEADGRVDHRKIMLLK